MDIFNKLIIGFCTLLLIVVGTIYAPLLIMLLGLLAIVFGASLMIGVVITEVISWIRGK